VASKNLSFATSPTPRCGSRRIGPTSPIVPMRFFHDPYARALAGERGKAIVAKREASRGAFRRGAAHRRPRRADRDRCPGGDVSTPFSIWLQVSTRDPIGSTCPAQLRWIEVDMPELVAYKERVLGRCAAALAMSSRVSLDLRERRLTPRYSSPASAGRPLRTRRHEGLLAYLEPDHGRRARRGPARRAEHARVADRHQRRAGHARPGPGKRRQRAEGRGPRERAVRTCREHRVLRAARLE